MARGARAENIPAAPSNENVPIASSTTFNDFDAEASLLALQKHVDAAAANGGVANPAAKIEQAFPQLSPEEHAANSIAYAASAALLAARSANTQTQAQPQPYPDSEAKIHPELRTSYSPSYSTSAHTNTNTNVAMSSAAPAVAAAPAASPQQAHAVPAPQPHTVAAPVAPQQSVSPAASQEHSEVITDGRKGPRRELSTSKRAAQNRAAQRAFRQRKEGYIKKLEQQVHDYGDMENQFKATQSENYALREYIIHLQSRLLDAKAELPQPPANVNLTAPGMPPLISMGQQPRHQQMHVQPQQQSPQPQYQEQQHAARTPSPAQHAAAAPAAAQAVAAAAAAAAAAATNEAVSPRESSVPSDGKNDSSLARVAQAVAQLGNAANGAPVSDHSTSNGVTNGNGAADTKPDPGVGEPMDTEEEAISQKVHKLSDPASS